MSLSGFMWECSCGNVEYGEEEPEECEKCGKVGEFIKMPEEIVEERNKEMTEEEPPVKQSRPAKKVKKNGRKR